MRARHQDGRVEARGSRWYGHYYIYVRDETGKETRQHKGVVLGDRATTPKFQAKDALRGHIKRAAKSLPALNQTTLQWFTEERFLPMIRPKWAASTRETNDYHVRLLLSALGSTALCELDKFQCQIFLNNLADQEFSFTVIDHCRTMLRAVLEEAADADLIGKNPARKLITPERPEPEKPVLSNEHARALFEALPCRLFRKTWTRAQREFPVCRECPRCQIRRPSLKVLGSQLLHRLLHVRHHRERAPRTSMTRARAARFRFRE